MEAVSKFKIAGFRHKNGFKRLRKQGLHVKTQYKNPGITKGGIDACYLGIIKETKHQLGRFTAVEVTRHEC